jgi:RNA polymerase sigma-70 factor (ECF subfamily)
MDKKKLEERNRLFDGYFNKLKPVACEILKNQTKASEIVEGVREPFVFSKEEIKNPVAWLRKVVRNSAYARKKIDSKTVSLNEIPDRESKSPTPLACLLAKETKERLCKAISELPDIYRDAIRLYYFDGKSAVEAAKLLGIIVSNFLSRLHRARIYLFGLLGGDDFLY